MGIYIYGAELTAKEKEKIQNNLLQVNSTFYDSSVCNSMLRRDFVIQHNCRFHYLQITHGEDSIYIYELVAHSPVQTELDIPCYLYRNRPGSAQTSNSLESSRRKLKSYLNAALIMQQHWRNNDGNRRDTANLLMSFIWYTLYTSMQVPKAERKQTIKSLKKAGLFPYQRPVECTHIRSYQTTRIDFIGKMFDKLYINLHRPWGFCGMFLLQRLISLKHHFHK